MSAGWRVVQCFQVQSDIMQHGAARSTRKMDTLCVRPGHLAARKRADELSTHACYHMHTVQRRW